jgi:protein TonB
MFERVAAVKTSRPLWLQPWGMSASAAAHVAIVAGIAMVPVGIHSVAKPVEWTTYLMLTEAVPPRRLPPPPPLPVARGPKPSLVTALRDAPRVSAPSETRSAPRRAAVPDRLPGPSEELKAPDEAAAEAPLPEKTPDLGDLAADNLASSGATTDLSGAVEAGMREAGVVPVVSTDALAEAPVMLNRDAIQRLLGRMYPLGLNNRGVEGEVQVTFIIGPDGYVEMSSVQVIAATHKDFIGPTLRGVARMRFRPALLRGLPVRVRATVPVTWRLQQAL